MTATRSITVDEDASSLASTGKRAKLSPSPNPLQLKPTGNLLFNPQLERTRIEGLGSLARLPDELLLSYIFGGMEGEDLVRMSGVSKAFFAWGHVEGIWKGCYISKAKGRLMRWHGSWRSSYVATFLRPASYPFSEPLPTSGINTSSLHSDVLFQPALCAAFDPRPLFLSNQFVANIPRIDGRGLTPGDLPAQPAILTGLMDHWGAMTSSANRWTLDALSLRFPTTLFRAEATLTTLSDYSTYHDRCEMDESPLYLFESQFVDKTEQRQGGGLGTDYDVPGCFREDLFAVMGDERPDYRWLIVGPTRSGSTWHQDPNGTSAWNACTVGSKAWIMFPPDVTPPGVYVSEDHAEVEAPLSLAEWFISYYKEAKAKYGVKAKDSATRGIMLEGICRAGEIFFVPSGWWHIVVNLEPAVAVTQNFVSRRELPDVLRFMRDRPEQVSGFKLRRSTTEEEESGLGEEDECVSGVFEKFCVALQAEMGTEGEVARMVEEVENGRVVEAKEGDGGEKRVKISLWDKVKATEEAEGDGGFSFGFGFPEGDEMEELDS